MERNLVTITLDDYDMLADTSSRVNVLMDELVNRDLSAVEIFRILGHPSRIDDYEERIARELEKLANWKAEREVK